MICLKGYVKIPGDRCDETGMDEKFKRQETKLRRNCPEEEELEVIFELYECFQNELFSFRKIMACGVVMISPITSILRT